MIFLAYIIFNIFTTCNYLTLLAVDEAVLSGPDDLRMLRN